MQQRLLIGPSNGRNTDTDRQANIQTNKQARPFGRRHLDIMMSWKIGRQNVTQSEGHAHRLQRGTDIIMPSWRCIPLRTYTTLDIHRPGHIYHPGHIPAWAHRPTTLGQSPPPIIYVIDMRIHFRNEVLLFYIHMNLRQKYYSDWTHCCNLMIRTSNVLFSARNAGENQLLAPSFSITERSDQVQAVCGRQPR